jgi:hypothetical protein
MTCAPCGLMPPPYTWDNSEVMPEGLKPPAAFPCAPRCKFEVRTKVTHWMLEGTQMLVCPKSFTYKAHECVRTTHELYLSGQLLGTLEEL